MSFKIIQILMATNEFKHPNALLGLGDDGVVYMKVSNEWKPFIPLERTTSNKKQGAIKLLSDNKALNGMCVSILKRVGINTERELMRSDISALDIILMPQGGIESAKMIMSCVENLKRCK